MTPEKTNAIWPDYKCYKIKRTLGGIYDFKEGQLDILPIRFLASSGNAIKKNEKPDA